MNIYLINLDRSTDRLAQQHDQFAQLGLSFIRLPAVSVNDISIDTYRQCATKGQRLMKQTELACLFSHKKAWEQVIVDDQPCVILEDDAILVQDFAHVLTQIEQLSLNVDFINLEVHGRQKIVGKRPIVSLNSYHLYELLLDKSGTGGYIIYPSGAKKLLAHLNKTIQLADAFIYQCPNLNKLQIEPALLLQSDKCALYQVPFDAYELQSMIGVIANTHQIELNLKQKIQLKFNRIIAQLNLGILTLTALILGKKRHIQVDNTRFMTRK